MKVQLTHPLRQRLVQTALEWEREFGVAPAITTALSEFDAAILVGHSPTSFGQEMQGATAVRKGVDFQWQGRREFDGRPRLSPEDMRRGRRLA